MQWVEETGLVYTVRGVKTSFLGQRAPKPLNNQGHRADFSASESEDTLGPLFLIPSLIWDSLQIPQMPGLDFVPAVASAGPDYCQQRRNQVWARTN
jgi:hypothetical protein